MREHRKPRHREDVARPFLIEGLRYLPKVQAERDRIEQEATADLAKEFLDCMSCEARMTTEERGRFNCGRLPVRLRSRGIRPFPDAEICPGHTIQAPEVLEAARALSWRKDGQLNLLYDEPITQLLRDAIDVLDGAVREQSRADIRRATRGDNHGPR